MTKSEFFAEMKECRVNASAFITTQGHNGGKTALVMIQVGAPNACLSTHRNESEALYSAMSKYSKWLKEYFAQAAEELNAQIDADLKAGRPVCEETGADLREWSGIEIEEAHAEALAFNAEVDEVAAADQWDEWANQHDSRKTKAQMIESDHAEALEMEARRNLIARQARFVFHNTAAERAQAIEEAHAEALALNAKYNRAAMKKKTVDFVFSGVSGRAQVDGKSVLIHWAGQVFYLAAAAAAMRAHVIKQLSIAGAL
ncbi:TPA: hypothetical protein NPP08_000827 [Klebsiella quasipneumoniae subsp. similipneumoniae]|nr:hypothetical protein [Klebsiella quasipneumoniae subsp. similipneumoniae]